MGGDRGVNKIISYTLTFDNHREAKTNSILDGRDTVLWEYSTRGQ